MDPGSKYTNANKAIAQFKKDLKSMRVDFDDITQLGYDDVTVILNPNTKNSKIEDIALSLTDKYRDKTPKESIDEYEGVVTTMWDYADEELAGDPERANFYE